MKKTNAKLQLKKQSVRLLQGDELANVGGGGNTNLCTNVLQTCKAGFAGAPLAPES